MIQGIQKEQDLESNLLKLRHQSISSAAKECALNPLEEK